MVYVRRMGIYIFRCLDNRLLKSSSSEEVLAHINTTLCLFDRLGLILNTVKSTLAPIQQIELIGALLDSMKSKVFL